jgi:hypothetical protein
LKLKKAEMTIQAIIDIEDHNKGEIHLYKESIPQTTLEMHFRKKKPTEIPSW